MRRIVIIGSTGQLGADLVLAAQGRGHEVTGLTHSDVDLCDAPSMADALRAVGPNVVINTAAHQGASTYEASNQEAYFAVNALAVWALARCCQTVGCTLVHYSSDYVFGNDRAHCRPYTEADAPYPVNVYGNSKLAGEHFVGAFCRQHYVIRTASLYGKTGCRAKGNSHFVKRVIEKAQRHEPLEVVTDQIMSPTWTRSVAAKTLDLVESGAPFGLCHVAGSGSCSWYEFAREIVRILGNPVAVTPTTTPEEPPDALFLRPRYTALANARLREFGIADLRPWQEDLEEYILKEELA